MASSCADTLRMEVPEAPAGPIRPTLAVVLLWTASVVVRERTDPSVPSRLDV